MENKIGENKNYMRNIEKYYDNTEINPPNINVKTFVEMEPNAGKAIELGCGAGRDTVYLIKNKWNVLAIDRENVEDRIIKRLNEEDLKDLDFKDKTLKI